MVFTSIMDIYKNIKDSKGWTPYKMADRLNITQTQLSHYMDKPISTREILLVDLQELSGLSLADFWELLSKEAKAAKQKRIKELIKKLSK